MQPGNIIYLRNKEIDRRAWDACIEGAGNGLIYAYSFYLDIMCSNWDALVLNNYEAVMPLPWRKKWGIAYLYQPFLVAQLGLFGNSISASLLESFLQHIPAAFKYWDMMLNYKNVFTSIPFPIYRRSTYTVSLQQPYEVIYAAYRDNIKRNIKRAFQYKCTIQKDIAVDAVITLAKGQATNKDIPAEDFDALKKVYAILHERRQAITYGVYAANRELVASCVLFFSHHRIYYMLVGNHPNGRTLGASHALIDAFIKDYAGSEWILDFEGSDVRNLAFFYSSFGATEEVYTAVKWNRLPWYMKWLKD